MGCDMETQHYLHCPECGVLDRIFRSTDSKHVQEFCPHCRKYSPFRLWVRPMESREWIANRLGREISVVRRSHLHGRISCGWFNEDKIHIADVGEYKGNISPVADAIFELAVKEAERLNAEEPIERIVVP